MTESSESSQCWTTGSSLVVLTGDRLFYRRVMKSARLREAMESIRAGDNPAHVLDERTTIISLDRIESVENSDPQDVLRVYYLGEDGSREMCTITPGSDDFFLDREKFRAQLFDAIVRTLGPDSERREEQVSLGKAIAAPAVAVIATLLLTLVLYGLANLVDANDDPRIVGGRVSRFKGAFIWLVQTLGVSGVTGIGLLFVLGTSSWLLRRIFCRPRIIQVTRGVSKTDE